MADRLTGGETFQFRHTTLPVSVLDFWQWVASDLLDNALRGKLAEFLVGQALNCLEGKRKEWDAFDLVTAAGVKIEVKSAAYVQSWRQSAPSKISFRIKPTQAWEAATNTWANESRRNADVYVFCVLVEQDPDRVDPLNLDQWVFYVVSTAELDSVVGSQATISLARLEKLKVLKSDYGSLLGMVTLAADSRNSKPRPDRHSDS